MSTSAAERLTGVRAKIERSKKHIRELDSVLKAFFGGNPYLVVKEHDPNTGNLLFNVRVRSQIPDEVSLISGDILNNLRAALDHLAWQLVEANGSKPGVQTCFPICKSANEYKAQSAGKVKGMSQGAVDLIDAAKPYKGGNDELWLIHDLNRIDKHRLILPVASYSGGMSISIDRRVLEFPASIFKRLEDGAALSIITEAARSGGLVMKMDNDPQFAFAVTFSEPEILKGKPIVPLFQQMSHFVERIVDQFVPLL
jgi:hypothetical protein